MKENPENVTSPDAKNKSNLTLDKLTEKLDKQLSEDVKSCWIDPAKILLDKFLGHGKALSNPAKARGSHCFDQL